MLADHSAVLQDASCDEMKYAVINCHIIKKVNQLWHGGGLNFTINMGVTISHSTGNTGFNLMYEADITLHAGLYYKSHIFVSCAIEECAT